MHHDSLIRIKEVVKIYIFVVFAQKTNGYSIELLQQGDFSV